MTAIYAALYLLVAAAPAPPEQVQYLAVGPDEASVRALEKVVSTALPKARRARIDNAPFIACRTRLFHDYANRCMRALLPDTRPVTVVLAVEPGMNSNVTGSVVHHWHDIRCLGQRGSARIELGRKLLSDATVVEAASKLRACIDSALADDDTWSLFTERDGVRTWRFPVVPERLAGDSAQARGSAPEYAIVEVFDAITTHRVKGSCSLTARIIHVEGGRRLRAGDEVTFEGPCRWEGADKFSKMMTQGGFLSGRSARVYVRYDSGELLYAEAL